MIKYSLLLAAALGLANPSRAQLKNRLGRAVYAGEAKGGVETLTATVPAVRVDEATGTEQNVPQMLTAIPYYAWANRGKDERTGWFPAKVVDVYLVACSTLQQKEKK